MDNELRICGWLVHPVANMMPYMSETELNALTLDIEKNGIIDPVVLFRKDGQDYLVDGRHRSTCCERLGIIPPFKYFEGDESSLLNFVISTNLQRRHLNSGQKAAICVEMLPVVEAQTRSGQSEKISAYRSGEAVSSERVRSADIIGSAMGVSGRYVAQAKRLFKENVELFEQVKSGVLSLSKAMSMLGKVEKCEILHNSEVENVEVAASVAPAPVSAPTQLSKSENKKVSELVALGLDNMKAQQYIISKRRNKSTPKPKSFSESRVEFKVSAEQKSQLVQLAKSKGLSVSEYLRSVLGIEA